MPDDVELAAWAFEATEQKAPNGSGPTPPRPNPLTLRPAAEVYEHVLRAGRRTFLIEGLIVKGSYGVLGAVFKGLKTMDQCDLSVSVVTGTPWFNYFRCTSPGPVVAYFGEGDEAAMMRRFDAILENRGATRSDLEGLHLAFRVPRFGDKDHIAFVRSELEAIRPALCVIDPAYIAAAGGKGGSVFDMGELLAPIQEVCQDVGTTLSACWHWNQTGKGTGASRFTGAGAAEWGRFLGSASIERKTSENGATETLSRYEFVGSEIPDTAFRVRRRLWADEVTDPDSPLHYEVEVTDTTGEVWTARARVLAALRHSPATQTTGEIGDHVAGDGKGQPLAKRTIQDALKKLVEDGELKGDTPKGREAKWWIPTGGAQ